MSRRSDASVDWSQKLFQTHAINQVIDVGANIGGFVSTWLELGANSVHAVEPVPHLMNALHTRFDHDPRVTLHQYGISDEESFKPQLNVFNAWTLLPDNSRSLDRAVEYAQQAPFDVQFVTLDALIEKNGLRPDFIKIDVDGFEAKVLRGATHVLDGLRPIVMFEASYLPNYLGDCCECMVRSIYDRGYVISDLFENEYYEDTRAFMKVYPWTTSFDVLLIPEERRQREKRPLVRRAGHWVKEKVRPTAPIPSRHR